MGREGGEEGGQDGTNGSRREATRKKEELQTQKTRVRVGDCFPEVDVNYTHQFFLGPSPFLRRVLHSSFFLSAGVLSFLPLLVVTRVIGRGGGGGGGGGGDFCCFITVHDEFLVESGGRESVEGIYLFFVCVETLGVGYIFLPFFWWWRWWGERGGMDAGWRVDSSYARRHLTDSWQRNYLQRLARGVGRRGSTPAIY